jgi:transcriptional pleiotropic regulator of transition state genes
MSGILVPSWSNAEGLCQMKSTGIVRRVDELGRVVLPIELRRNLGIGDRDSLEIYVEGDNIVLTKYAPACVFCGSLKNVTEYKEKNVCAECLEGLRTTAV